jgi:hypothetical protein
VLPSPPPDRRRSEADLTCRRVSRPSEKMINMSSMSSLLGAFLVAVGASIQAARWLLTEGGVIHTRRALVATRTERLELRRAVRRAQTDWTAWTLVAAGAWFVTVAELAGVLS